MEEEPALLIIGDQGIDVDADENPDFRNVLQQWPDSEPAGRAEVADQSVECREILIRGENALKLGKERLRAVVGEEAGGH